jgi:hypothetical protein
MLLMCTPPRAAAFISFSFPYKEGTAVSRGTLPAGLRVLYLKDLGESARRINIELTLKEGNRACLGGIIPSHFVHDLPEFISGNSA